MMNGQQPRLTLRKQIRIMIALTILAWATQTLFHQLGYGQAITQDSGLRTQDSTTATATESFVPGTARFAAGATLELRGEATVIGSEVKLKQICRWSDTDASVFAPIAELVLVRLGSGTPFRSIDIEEVKGTLRDAGVNMAVIKFAGATSCTISRTDVQFDEGQALQQWITAHSPASEQVAAPTDAANVSSGNSKPVATVEEKQPTIVAAAKEPPSPQAEPPAAYRTLRDLLIEDLSKRTNLSRDVLQVDFAAKNESALNLAEPHFKFNIEPRRVRNLGEVAWEVTILADAGSQKLFVTATARAWQEQVVVMKPLAFKQIIRDEDIIERRTLVDALGEDPLLARNQVIGQQAAREIKPGTILTARLIDAVPLVKPGQYVTISLQQGGVTVKSVAKAVEGGAFGQTIRVKNETTKDIFEVVVTGPQAARMGPVASVVEPIVTASGQE